VTAVLEASADAAADGRASARPLASWQARAAALSLDLLLGVGVLAVLAPLVVTAPQRGWLWWVYIIASAVIVALILANRWLLPTVTGWSLGRALVGIRVDRRGDDEPAGFVRLMVRDFAHLLDTAFVFVGWLWPLWDSRHRTFADMLLRTEVLRVERPRRDINRFVAVFLIGVALLCAAAAGLGYLAVYRHERAVDAARAQIADEGPRIVEQMLSYGADTMPADFARAQGLTTDGYREQLIAQQQAAQKAGVTSNEYWAVSSAVLTNPPVTPDQASMLLAMQGQRGVDVKDLKFITATVRADFDKSRDGRWRVSNLIVLKKPQMNVPGQ